MLQGVLDGAERTAIVRLGYDPSSQAATVYLDGNGTENLVLPRKPVPSAASITNVWLDEGGFYGSVTDSFDATDTLLTAGVDYFYKANSTAGILVRMGRFWPVARRRPLDRLGTETTPLLGCVKVTFTSGLTPTELADIAEAIYMESAARWVSRTTGMGPFQSESLDGYSRTLGSGSSSESFGPSSFLSPVAREIIWGHRLTPWA